MTPEFSRLVEIETVDERGRTIDLAASADERDALRRRLDLQAVDELKARASLVRRGARLTVDLHWTAKVVQTCVTTLSALPRAYEGRDKFVYDVKADNEPVIDAETDLDLDAPETLERPDQLDVGEDVVQALSLALDPFPRSPDAPAPLGGEAADMSAGGSQTRRPFAGLADMLNTQHEKNG